MVDRMIHTQANRRILKFAYPAMILLMFILVGCGPADVALVPTAVVTPLPDAYPATTSLPPEAYPPPMPTARTGTLLALDKPIRAGDTVVSGVGPASLPVVISNITFLGEQLGAGVIGDDGIFSIEVSQVPSSIRIGLTADIGSIGLMESDIRPGDDAISVPEVGYFYDSFVILQE